MLETVEANLTPMNHHRTPAVVTRALGVALLAVSVVSGSCATNIFSTRFEVSEGYSTAWTLAGQQDWLGEGTGGNGIATNLIAGQGQQAYIGYYAPATTNEDYAVVWRPIGLHPVAANLPVVKFSVLMNIEDSTFEAWDNFRWSIYNQQTNRLFSLDFDNFYRDVSYLLDGANGLTNTPVTFTNGQAHLLTVTMNYASNRWSASLDSRLIATNLPMTTVNAELSLGEIDALWLIYDPEFPGDNDMLFDNFELTAESAGPPPRPRLDLLGRAGSQTWLRLTGQSGTRFSIDATTNFTAWTALKTNVTSDGYFDYVDSPADPAPRRYYRGRWVP